MNLLTKTALKIVLRILSVETLFHFCIILKSSLMILLGDGGSKMIMKWMFLRQFQY